MTLGFKASGCRIESPLGPLSRLVWSLYICAAFWRTVYGAFVTKRPLGTTRDVKGISSQFWASTSLQYDLLKAVVNVL